MSSTLRPAEAGRCLTLTFTELEALARSGHAVFLAFLRARVAREESLVLQCLAQFPVVHDERARDAQAHGAGLSRHATPRDSREDIELIGGFGEHQRRPDLRPQRFGGEERLESSVIDAD